jgi:hemerythrin superfamily protein
MPDAITILQEDHRRVESLFEQYKQKKDPTVVEQICNELTVHTIIEESLVYPMLASEAPKGKETEPELVQEHMEVKNAIAQIKLRGPDDPSVDRLVQTIIDGITHHVTGEENEVFPLLREALGQGRLAALGDMLISMKEHQMEAVTAAAREIARSATGQQGGAGQKEDLVDLTREELYELAKEKGIPGRSDMSKDELIKALQG